MRRTPKWSLLGLIAALVLAVVFGVRQTPTANAHAVLERSLPAQGAKLAAAPELVEMWFSEPLERNLTKLRVYDTAGKELQQGETQFSDSDGFYASVALPATLGPGVYVGGYENVSKVDGHAWTGSISFIVLNADGSVPTGEAHQLNVSNQGYLPGVGDNTLRWFALLAAVTITGAAAFYLFVARPAAEFLSDDEIERVEDSAMAISADLIVIAVPVLVLSVIGQAFLLADRLGGPDKLSDIFFNTRTGELWIARLGLSIALLLLFVPALFSERYRRGDRTRLVMAMALLGGSGLLMTYSLNSHGATGGGEFWSVASDFVHFLATAAWLGALIELPLLFWWTRSKLNDDKRLLYLANVLDRFAWLAVISVTLLIGTGVFNGFVELPTKEALWETTYGRVLIAKLALILPLLGIAGLNAVFIAPRLSDAIDALHEEDAPEAMPASQPRFAQQIQRLQAVLPKTIALELFLGAAVLVSVAVLTQTTTAKGEIREEAGKPSGQFVSADQAGDLNAELKIEPFGVGLGTFTVTMSPEAGQELGEVQGVRLRAFYDDPNAPIAAGSGGTDQDLAATDTPGVWSAEGALLTQPGDWRLESRIRRRGEDDVTARYDVPQVGGVLAARDQPDSLFDLPFTFVDWNTAAGGAMIAFGIGIYLIYRNRPPTWQRSTSISVGVAAVVPLIAGAVLLFGVHPHEPVKDKPGTPESIQAGQGFFIKNCISCHGANGRGNNTLGADLTQHVPYHNDTTLYIWVTEGIPLDSETKRMPSFKDTLSSDERQDVVNYLRSAFGDLDFTPVLPSDSQARIR